MWTPPTGRLSSEPPLRPLGDYRKLAAVRVRYTVLDGRHEQRIPLENPPAVRCP